MDRKNEKGWERKNEDCVYIYKVMKTARHEIIHVVVGMVGDASPRVN